MKERGWRHHQSQAQERMGLEVSTSPLTLGASRWSWTSCSQPGEWFCPGLLPVRSTLYSPVSYPPGVSPRMIFAPWCISGKQHFCQAVPGPASSPTSPPYSFAHSRTSFFPHRAQHLSASGRMDTVDRNQFSSDNRCGKTSTRLQGLGLDWGNSEVFKHTIIHSLRAGARGGENSKSASVPGYATLMAAERMRSGAAAAMAQDAKATKAARYGAESRASAVLLTGALDFFLKPNGLFFNSLPVFHTI